MYTLIELLNTTNELKLKSLSMSCEKIMKKLKRRYVKKMQSISDIRKIVKDKTCRNRSRRSQLETVSL